jgi:hypothetical protein
MPKPTKADPGGKLTISISGPVLDVLNALIHGLPPETLVKVAADLAEKLPIVTMRQRPVRPRKGSRA